MRILYAIQATGNGHISRANEIIPLLEKKADVDILLSGTGADITLNHFVKYRRKGLSFVFGKKGVIDFIKTLQQLKTKNFLEEVKSVPVANYDLVINDFEPLSAWSCKLNNVLCISLSHQYALISKASPKPAWFDPVAWLVMIYYAPSNFGVGFHFKNYDINTFGPVIRSEIRNAYTRNQGHYVVYLPSFSDKKLIRVFSAFNKVEWHIFSKKAKKNYSEGNCWIRPITNYDFVSSLTTCEGIICSAGFETPAEAIFLGKKLMVVPEKGQYEQYCNAKALEELNVPILKNFKKKKLKIIAHWLNVTTAVHFPFPDTTQNAIDEIFKLPNYHYKRMVKDIMVK